VAGDYKTKNLPMAGIVGTTLFAVCHVDGRYCMCGYTCALLLVNGSPTKIEPIVMPYQKQLTKLNPSMDEFQLDHSYYTPRIPFSLL
jgi:hypothetical protein